MNRLGKLNHGNMQGIGLGSLNNNINTEISSSVEAGNNIIGSMSEQRKDMLTSVDNIENNLIGTKNQQTGERNFDGLIGRAYKNEAIAKSNEELQKELTRQKIELNKKLEEYNKDGKILSDILGAKQDVSNAYKNDKSIAMLGNPFNVEKESLTRYFMANIGLDIETAVHSWNNGGKNSQAYQSLKAAGLNEEMINQVMSRANTMYNLEKEAKNLENGVIPKDVMPKMAYETNKALIGRGYTPEQAARLTQVGIQNSITNIYQASATAEAEADKIRLQKNYMDRNAIALQNQMSEQERHIIGRTIGRTNQQPINEEEIVDNPNQTNYRQIVRVEPRGDGSGTITVNKGNGVIEQLNVEDMNSLKAYDENGNIVKLDKAESYVVGDGKNGIANVELDRNAKISSYNEGGGDRSEKGIRDISSKILPILNEIESSKGRLNKTARIKELKAELKELYKELDRALGGGYLLENGELDYKRAYKEVTTLQGNEGPVDTLFSKVGDVLNPYQKQKTMELFSQYGSVVDRGNLFMDQNYVTNKYAIGDKKQTWNQYNGNTQLNKMQNNQHTNNPQLLKANKNPITIDGLSNPNSKEFFEIQERAKNGDKEAISALQSKMSSEIIVNSVNKEVASYVNDDQKMIKNTEIDAKHLNQDSKNQALTAISIMSVTVPQLRTDRVLADKVIKALYNNFELQRLGKFDGNWSEVFKDFKDSLDTKKLSNIGLNITSTEDLGDLFSRDDIRKMISSPDINKNSLQLLLYFK